MFRDRTYWGTLIKIAVPVTLQNLIMNGLNMIDVMMIGQLGDTAVASVGLANEISFVLGLITFGISSGGSIFAAQYWGKKDIGNLRKVLGLSLAVGVTVSTLFMLFAILFPETALSIYTRDPAVIQIGAQYLQLIGIFYIPWVITSVYSAILRSTENVKLPILVSIVAISIKTLLNFLLINGNLGFPALGVRGAAFATMVSRTLECSSLLVLVYVWKTPAAATFKELFHLDWPFIKKFFTTTLPVIINETLWSLGITTYSAVYARIGTEAIAAFTVARTIEQLMFVFFMGIGIACAIMVGNRIGAGEEKIAYIYSKRSLFTAIIVALVLGIILVFASSPILSLYKISDLSKTYAVRILLIAGFSVWIRAANMVIFVGILRSGGDTRYGFLTELFSMYIFGIPLAFIGALVFHLPVYWVYLLVLSDELVKMLIGLRRVFSRRWINNLVLGITSPASADLPAGK